MGVLSGVKGVFWANGLGVAALPMNFAEIRGISDIS